MSLKLKDLRNEEAMANDDYQRLTRSDHHAPPELWVSDGYRPVVKGPAERVFHPASLADLVEVLKLCGATIEVVGEPGYQDHPGPGGWVEAGSYLVLKLEDA